MALPGVAPTYQYIGGESQDGWIVGVSSSIAGGFFGIATPVTQPTSADQAAVATTVPSSSATVYALTSAQQVTLVALANALRTALVNLNLIKGS